MMPNDVDSLLQGNEPSAHGIMGSGFGLWVRETWQLFLAYLLIGLLVFPFALAGFYLQQRSPTTFWPTGLLLIVSFSVSVVIWPRLRKFQSAKVLPAGQIPDVTSDRRQESLASEQAEAALRLKLVMINAIKKRSIPEVASELDADFNRLQEFEDALVAVPKKLGASDENLLVELLEEARRLEEKAFYAQIFEDPAERHGTCAVSGSRRVSWRPIGTFPVEELAASSDAQS